MSLSSLALAVLAAGLTVHPGETWLFRIADGNPVAARRVAAEVAPARGEIRISARRMLGTLVTLQNNSRVAYNFRAALIASDGKAVAARSCVLPADNRATMESWPQVAIAVRISDFKPTRDASCR